MARLKEQKTVCKELQPCNLVLEFAADSCRMGFREYIAEQAWFAGAVARAWRQVSLCTVSRVGACKHDGACLDKRFSDFVKLVPSFAGERCAEWHL
jgi:hypothetical protein